MDSYKIENISEMPKVISSLDSDTKHQVNICLTDLKTKEFISFAFSGSSWFNDVGMLVENPTIPTNLPKKKGVILTPRNRHFKYRLVTERNGKKTLNFF